MSRSKLAVLIILGCWALLTTGTVYADVAPPPCPDGQKCEVGGKTGTCKNELCVPYGSDAGQPLPTSDSNGCSIAAETGSHLAPTLLSLLALGLWRGLRRR
jgi:hypothetical protein